MEGALQHIPRGDGGRGPAAARVGELDELAVQRLRGEGGQLVRDLAQRIEVSRAARMVAGEA